MRATFPPPPLIALARLLALVALLVALMSLAGCQLQPWPGADADTDADTDADRPGSRAEADEQAALPVRPVRIPKIPHMTASTAATPDLWEAIRGSFELDHAPNRRRVQQQLRWLQSHPQHLMSLQDRMQRYLPYIHAEIRARGLPGELALLPILESALDPYAFSRSGAVGLWQFMPATATRFGLPRNWWVDGRRDPVLATNAALDYLEYLHADLQDWHLALAAYNAGEGTIRRAVQQSGGEGSLWELRLPGETNVYVPRLLALAMLVADPESYGIELPPLDAEAAFFTVETHGQFDLIKAASALGVEIDALYEWNPALNQWSTPPQGPHHLHVPVSLAETAQDSISAVPERERVQWLRVKANDGDTLSRIAQRHKTDVATLRSVNNLSSDRIRAGQSLLVPRSGKATAARPGTPQEPRSEYRVKRGDSLWAIARDHGVSVDALMKANDIGPNDVLKVGHRLTLPVVAGTAETPRAGRDTVRRVNYGVRRGDSLTAIARRFNVAVGDIAKWNQLDVKKHLQPGQSLLIYPNVAAAD